MKLNKKGFTLVEVIAVVVILGILAVLIVPSVTKYLQGGKDNYDENLKKELILVAKNYYSENKDKLPGRNGSTSSYVTLKELISLKYTSKDFIDSKGNSCNNDTYVTTWLNDNDNIDYYACMKCGTEQYYDSDEKCQLISNTDPNNPDENIDNSITCDVKTGKGSSSANLTIKSENSNITRLQWRKNSNEQWKDIDISNESTKKSISKTIDVYKLDKFGTYQFRAINAAGKIEKCTDFKYEKSHPTIPEKISSKMYLVKDESLVDKKVDDIAQKGTLYDGETWESGWVYVNLDFEQNKFKNVTVNSTSVLDKKYFWIKEEDLKTTKVLYEDKNNNNGEITLTTKLDRTPPVLGSISNSSNGAWTKSAVTITSTATDNLSGVEEIVYGTAAHEKIATTFNGKWDSTSGFGTKNASATKKWTAADRDISMFIKVRDKAGNETITCNSNLNGNCYTNIRQDITPPYIDVTSSRDKWHCGRGKSGNGYDCDIYVYYFHDNLSGVLWMKHGHCYGCTAATAKATLDSKSLEKRDWAGSDRKKVEYCMPAGNTARIYFEVCDRVMNCKTFGPYTDSVNSSPTCTGL